MGKTPCINEKLKILKKKEKMRERERERGEITVKLPLLKEWYFKDNI